LIYPLVGQTKTNFIFFFKNFSFLFGLLGGKLKQKYFTGVNQKKYFTGEKPEMTYITGGKDLLTHKQSTNYQSTKVMSKNYIKVH